MAFYAFADPTADMPTSSTGSAQEEVEEEGATPSHSQAASAKNDSAVSAAAVDVASSADEATDDEADDLRHVALLQPEAWAKVTIKSEWTTLQYEGCDVLCSDPYVNFTQ